MNKIKLYDYQDDLVRGLGVAVKKGLVPVIGQLPTGGGKTIVFSAIVKRLLSKTPNKRVLILVHREELRTQAKKSLKKFFGIEAHEIKAGDRYVPNSNIYCGLIQTIKNRVHLLP